MWKENNLVFCNDVGGLLQKMGLAEYNPQEWRLFIDSSVRSLKCVLLHDDNKYASIPIGQGSATPGTRANYGTRGDFIRHTRREHFSKTRFKMLKY